MRVQEIRTSNYQKRYVVIDGNGNLVVPVVRYLKYLLAIGRARNTLRSYAQSLSLYFTYLAQEHLEYQQVASENSWRIVELAIQPDHVHLFIQANPHTLPTDIARLIKGRSARDLREEFDTLAKMPSVWTRSTFYSTAGFVSQDTIQTYIDRQSKQ
jgi:putative transposase